VTSILNLWKKVQYRKAYFLFWPLIIVLINIVLIWPFLTKERVLIGNSDRLNADLAFLYSYVESRLDGEAPGWVQNNFAGLNPFGIGVIPFPGVVSILATLGREQFLYSAFLYSFFWFVLSGLSAWWYFRLHTNEKTASMVSGLLYQLSFASTFGFTQLVSIGIGIAFMPVLLGCLLLWYRTENLLYLAGTAISAGVILYYGNLQEGFYLIISSGFFVAWYAYEFKSIRKGGVVLLAIAAGCMTTIPKIMRLNSENLQVNRQPSQNFGSLFNYQNVQPWELLRWFDNTIFGENMDKNMESNLNYTEGFQLFTAQAVPWLIIILYYMAYKRKSSLHIKPTASFCLIVFFIAGLFSSVKPFYYILYLLFLKKDFFHCRVMIAGLVPICLCVAILLTAVKKNLPTLKWTTWLFGIFAGCLGAGLIRGISQVLGGMFQWNLNVAGMSWLTEAHLSLHFQGEAIVAIALTAFYLSSGFYLSCNQKFKDINSLVFPALIAFIITQAFIASRFELLGPSTCTGIPFHRGNSWNPQSGNFRLPTPQEVEQLHRRLEVEKYRSAALIQEPTSWGLLASSVAYFWQLRMLDGYMLGMPKNLAWLPWGKNGARMREIHLSDKDDIPWESLSLLNVKTIIVLNAKSLGSGALCKTDQEILENPCFVVPRVFFPHTIEALAAEEAIHNNIILESGKPRLDVVMRSVVLGSISKIYEGGSVDDIKSFDFGSRNGLLEVVPKRFPRFVVINERWHQGWSAYMNGKDCPMIQVNGCMMGIEVPENTNIVKLSFKP
jgi:hypothetical protein